tara:strand:+ start:3093 stop:3809 length:717 start_codon:yes stop_codon:yes gene_type:complete
MSKIICLWSCPRNVSTALMYSFGNRTDTEITDEVLYGYYLSKSNVNHPGKNEIIENLECDSQKVINEIILKPKKKVTFHKLMTHFLIDIDLEFLNKVTNVLFIRDPKEIIHSYHKVIPYPTIDDIGVKKQFELFNYLNDNGNKVIILDSKDLLTDPAKILNILCEKINIPFDKKMLQWKKGPKKEDGIWAKYWYKNVHKSNCFNTYQIKDIKLNLKNKKLAENCYNYYNILKENSIKI